jgi:zinc transport system ATP-binding protein
VTSSTAPAPAADASTPPAEDLLTVTNLGVTLDHHPVLEDVSFRVRARTTLAIVGPNGAGKTTLFRVLLGFLPHTGTVEWHRRVKVGYVPQQFSVTDVPITVREFLAFKCKTDYRECLAAVGLDGSDILGKRLGVLSGGEMQRVLIAWAIVDRPDVLLFDEPTSSVDIGSQDLVYETLNSLERKVGITVLLISHDIHTVMHYSDATLALNRGLIYFGESRELSDPVLLQKIFGSGSILADHEHANARARP